MIAFLILAVISGLIAFLVYIDVVDNRKKTVHFWHYFVNQKAFFDQELELFRQKYPNIHVEQTVLYKDTYKRKLTYSFKGFAQPDIFIPPAEKNTTEFSLSSMIQKDWIRSVDEFDPGHQWFSKFPKEFCLPGVNMLNGKVYSFPFEGEGTWVWNGLLINNKLFREAGLWNYKTDSPLLPGNWKEIRQFTKTITDSGKGRYWGFGFAGIPVNFHFLWMTSWANLAGAYDFVNWRTGKFEIAHEGFYEIVDLLLGMRDDGSIYYDSALLNNEKLNRLFVENKVAMMPGGTWHAYEWMNTEPQFKDYELIHIPPPDEKGYRGYFTQFNAYDIFMVMNSRTEVAWECWLLMKWFSMKETGERWVKGGYGTSVWPENNKEENYIIPQTRNFYRGVRDLYRIAPDMRIRVPGYIENGLVTKPDRDSLLQAIYNKSISRGRLIQELKMLEEQKNMMLDKYIEELKSKGLDISREDFVFPDWDRFRDYVTVPKHQSQNGIS